MAKVRERYNLINIQINIQYDKTATWLICPVRIKLQ